MRSSETKEQAIVRLHCEGKSNTAIRNILGTRTQKIKEVIANYQQTNQVPEPKKLGRPPIPNDVLTHIMAYTIQNRGTSCYNISKMLFTKWKRMVPFFENRTAVSLMKKYRSLFGR